MEREVKIQILCPNANVGILLGKNQSIIEQLRSEHHETEITLIRRTRNSIVTVSAMEKLMTADLVFYAVMKLLPLCSEVTACAKVPFHSIFILVDER